MLFRVPAGPGPAGAGGALWPQPRDQARSLNWLVFSRGAGGPAQDTSGTGQGRAGQKVVAVAVGRA